MLHYSSQLGLPRRVSSFNLYVCFFFFFFFFLTSSFCFGPVVECASHPYVRLFHEESGIVECGGNETLVSRDGGRGGTEGEAKIVNNKGGKGVRERVKEYVRE